MRRIWRMSLRRPLTALLIFLLTCTVPGLAAEPVPGLTGIDATRLRAHIEYLASDALEGRLTGTAGCQKAEAYIAAQMAGIGLTPMGDNGSWFDEFSFTSGISLAPENRCTITAGAIVSELKAGEDWMPMFFSPNGGLSGKVVFAGYGITAPEYKWDDYADLDVRGKLVMILRQEPGVDDPDSPFAGRMMTRYSDPRHKVIRAREAGAAGLIIVNGPLTPDGKADQFLDFRQISNFGEVGLPVFQLKRRHADTLLASSGLSIQALQEAMETRYEPVAVTAPDGIITARIALTRKTSTSSNVVGYLKGSDPKYRDQVIVIGAHHDHLGYGGLGSGSLSADPASIHNGADDNASGVAGVLELARAFAAEKNQLKRSICFVTFSGEELGLLGSSHFTKHPPFPIKNVVAMLNMDMIGRLNAEQALVVLGTGTAKDWPHAVDVAAAGLPLRLTTAEDGVGPSDQTPFVAQRIPVLSLFTKAHEDYHKPSDTIEKINFPGQVAVLTFAYRVLAPLARAEFTPVYTEVANGADAEQGIDTSRGFNIYLGTIPDYAVTDKLILQGVREGGPGWNAGLRGGDQLLRFGTIDIRNVYDYTYALQTYHPGETVDLLVRRGAEEFTITMLLEGRSQSPEHKESEESGHSAHAHGAHRGAGH